MSRSEELFRQAVELIPGGVNSPVRAYGAIGMAPRFIKRADGCHIYDVDDKDDVFVTSICINNLTEDNIYGNNLLRFAYIFKLDAKNMIGYAKEIFTNDIVSILEKVIKK